jgi:chaperonin cofactor prefoldin
MAVVTVFEFGFRIAFIVKRRFLPAPENILEEKLETEVEAITKAHFQKMENKEKELEKRLDELKKRLDESSSSS